MCPTTGKLYSPPLVKLTIPISLIVVSCAIIVPPEAVDIRYLSTLHEFTILGLVDNPICSLTEYYGRVLLILLLIVFGEFLFSFYFLWGRVVRGFCDE